MKTVATEISQLLNTILYCDRHNRTDWSNKHYARLKQICDKFLPHGAGIDDTPGDLVGLDTDYSNNKKLQFLCRFHHMNEAGYYDGWTTHVIKVYAIFGGIDIKVTGPNRNDIKDYLAEVYHTALTTDIQGW